LPLCAIHPDPTSSSPHPSPLLTQTAGGILLPESNIAKANEGVVVAVGPGFITKDGTKVPVTLDIGDKVILPEYGGLLLKIEGEEGFIFRCDEILAKLLP
jgi:chaperonin GroES